MLKILFQDCGKIIFTHNTLFLVFFLKDIKLNDSNSLNKISTTVPLKETSRFIHRVDR